MSFMVDDRSPFVEHGPVVPVVVARTATIAVGLTLLLGLILLPSVGGVLAEVSQGVTLGVLVLLTTGSRVAAGVFGARLLRRRYGTGGRGDAVPSVVLGAAVAFLAYLGLVLLSASAVGYEDSWWRLMVELPRWVVEAGLGALLVTPGPTEQYDPALRRFVGAGSAH